jgi:hypothetical protein
MALDRHRHPAGQIPTTGEHTADDRVVDAELLALDAEPLLRGEA